MSILLKILGAVVGVLVTMVVAHMAFIEIGKDVVTLWTTDDAGDRHFRRLWAVDHDGSVWLHSTGDSWHRLFAADREVELERSGHLARYQAEPVPGPHPVVDRLLREKYGLADRWVRFLAPCDDTTLVVRLTRTPPDSPT